MRGLTKNQVELLMLVRAGGPDGDLDFDQLLEQLSWEPSKESAQFTIRALVKRGLLSKLSELQFRRSRKRICYRLTPEGLQALDPRSPLPPEASEGLEKGGFLPSGTSPAEGLALSVEGEEFFIPGLVTVEVG